MKDSDGNISRRSFLGKSVAAAVGAGIGISGTARALAGSASPGDEAKAPGETEDKPRIKDYRNLGRTGWKVSDISFGGATIQDTALLEYAMERGINYVDTARQYYDMEVVVGKIFPAKRDKLYVTTKLVPELFTTKTTTEEVTTAIEESLQRLNTDHIDCCLIHSVGDPNLGDRSRIENPHVLKAFANAKRDGKIRAWGGSSHGPKMVEDFTWLIENTDIDLIMPGMNFMTKGLEPVLAKAKEKGVAVVAMKSLSAARKIDYSDYMKDGRTVRQAVLKWMLAQPGIDTIAITMRSFEEIDQYVSASGRPELSPKEKKALKEYGMLLDRDYCRPGCDGCLKSCPNGVPIHDILRYRLYFHSYAQEKHAIKLYASLPASRRAGSCTSCTAICEGSCPYGIAIKSKLLVAHSELTV